MIMTRDIKMQINEIFEFTNSSVEAASLSPTLLASLSKIVGHFWWSKWGFSIQSFSKNGL